jgi:prepilin signal peptidase PulO-like enzyme (type II secretory pathway)
MVDPVLVVVFFGLGAIFASFAGVIAERSFTGQPWHKGRSTCNACARSLSFIDLVPIVSWLGSLGRCRTCRARIPALYALVELSLGVAFAYAYVRVGLTPALPAFLGALVALAAIVLYDLRHMLVPAVFSAWFVSITLGYLLLSGQGLAEVVPTLVSAALIALFFFLLYALSGGRAMGLGDTPVAFGLALLAGPYALSGLAFSFWIGAVIGIIVLWATPGGPRMGIEVPFVPFLAAGFLLAYFAQWNLLSLIGF